MLGESHTVIMHTAHMCPRGAHAIVTGSPHKCIVLYTQTEQDTLITAHINLVCENNKPYWLYVRLIHVLLTYQAACRRSPNTPWITAQRRTATVILC